MAIEAISEEQVQKAEAVQQANDKLEEQKKAADDSERAQAEADKLAEVNQKLSTLPEKIEETIVSIREKLDTLLGKSIDSTTNPDSPEFDINAVVKPLMNAVVTPLTTAIAPLTVVAGKIPGLSDLGSITNTVSKESQPKVMTKKEILAKVPDPPEMPASLNKELAKISDNINAICMQLPLMLINLIFAMIDVIYSKLKIVTSVVPLGNFFPLSLIPSAKSAVPKIKDFITNAPGEVKKMVEGVVRQKMAEALALGVPNCPSVDAMKNTEASTENSASNVDSSSASGTTSTQQKDDAQVIKEADEAKSNSENSPSPTLPVESSVKEVEPNPPTPAPQKEYEEIEEFWKGKFAEVGLCVLKQNTMWKQYSADNEINYTPYIIIDDPWEYLRHSIEVNTLKDTYKANSRFKEVYRCITGIDTIFGHQIVLEDDYEQYELEQNDNGEYIKIRKYFNEHRSQFTVLDKEGVQQNRITVGSDRYNYWLEEIYSHKLYKKDYSNVKQSYFNLKLHADNGITKMEKLLNKYIILFESQLPTIRQLILLGRNKAFS